MHIKVVLLLAATILSTGEGLGCYEDGECTGGTLLAHTVVPTPEECSVDCEAQTGCQYFTHYRTSDICALFDSCPNYETDCADCVSGRNGCSCFQQGQCIGVTIQLEQADDEFACLDDCRAEPSCEWITYMKLESFCTLFETCTEIDDSYENNVSAPKYCNQNSTDEEPLQIMVATGTNGSPLDDVEILNIGGNSSCMKPPDFPREIYSAAGDFADGKARICGGWDNGDLSLCYEYSLGDASWTFSSYSLTVERYTHEGFVLSNGSWLLVGGYLSALTTDVYSGGVMEKGPDLPAAFDRPVGATVNSSHIFLSGVSYSYERAYLANVDTWEFTRLPDMAESKYHGFCGMVENEDGERELVVAGGVDSDSTYYDTSEIFNFGTMSWREGPRLPQAFARAEAVQRSKTFLVVGGVYEDGSWDYLDTVYEFDSANYGWILRDERLNTARYSSVSIPLPKEWEVC